ncbi:hypothetical protein BJ742DRAFT_816020 [Cladochytrium replicatum]|nr:hypothetical protein BJ742DRAFT_816020 [Cladochytrium replicatum]
MSLQYKSALLVLALGSTSTGVIPNDFAAIISNTSRRVTSRLVVSIDLQCALPPIRDLASLVAQMYLAAYDPSNPLLDTTIVFSGLCGWDPVLDADVEVVFAEAGVEVSVPRPVVRIGKRGKELGSAGGGDVKWEDVERYGRGAVGGTFDHLHMGHKVLLSAAVAVCKRRLVVGVVADDPGRFDKKVAKEWMQSYSVRVEGVKQFLRDFKRGVEIEIFELHDELGPVKDDAGIEALVGSEDTRKGCEMANAVRREKGVADIEIVIVDVVADALGGTSSKMSSSGIREYLSQHQQ